jgi:hypothetical protein
MARGALSAAKGYAKSMNPQPLAAAEGPLVAKE